MHLLTSQSTILFKRIFPWRAEPGGENSHARGEGTKVVVALPLNQESILIT
jgi:hypothetical protein